MQFLADESCDFSVVQALRDAGYDVSAIVEISPRSDDTVVMQHAIHEQRILLTEDKDFGQLVYAYGQGNHPVVLIRYPARARKQLARDVVRLVKLHGKKLDRCFVVLQPGRVRISRSL